MEQPAGNRFVAQPRALHMHPTLETKRTSLVQRMATVPIEHVDQLLDVPMEVCGGYVGPEVGRVFVSTDIVLLGWPAAGGSTFAHHGIESIVPRREQSHRHVRQAPHPCPSPFAMHTHAHNNFLKTCMSTGWLCRWCVEMKGFMGGKVLLIKAHRQRHPADKRFLVFRHTTSQ